MRPIWRLQMIKLDRDDKYHLVMLSAPLAGTLVTGWMFKSFIDQQTLEEKIYHCACYVITNLQEYGCNATRQYPEVGTNELCRFGGLLYRSFIQTNDYVGLFGAAFIVCFMMTAIAIASFSEALC